MKLLQVRRGPRVGVSEEGEKKRMKKRRRRIKMCSEQGPIKEDGLLGAAFLVDSTDSTILNACVGRQLC